MEAASDIRKIAFLGDYLPRKCGIATFTSDLLSAVAAEHPGSQCFAVPVNDIPGGYEYPGVEHLRFEVETITPEKIENRDGQLSPPPADYRELDPCYRFERPPFPKPESKERKTKAA